MGTVCVSYAEKVTFDKTLTVLDKVFPTQHITFFAWLGLERLNVSKILPVGKLIQEGEHYIYPVKLFTQFDYDQEFEDRQVYTEGESTWHATLPSNEIGVMRSYRDLFGAEWMEMVEKLKTLDVTHIRFYFC